MRRSGLERHRPWLVAAVAGLIVSGCSRSRTYENEQEALYAAEAGLEVAKMHLAEVCKSTANVARLRKLAADTEVSVPGYEQPTNVILGQTIRGTVSIRLRTVEQEPTMWVVVSTGERFGTRRVIQGRLSCPTVGAEAR